MHIYLQRSQKKAKANSEPDFASFFFVTPRITNDVQSTSPMISSIGKLFYGISSNKKPLTLQLKNGNKISKFGPTMAPNVFKEDFDSKSEEIQEKLSKDDPTNLPILIHKDQYNDFDSGSEKFTLTQLEHSDLMKLERTETPQLRFLSINRLENGTAQNNPIDFQHILRLQSKLKESQESQNVDYSCKYCGEVFKSGCGLGGHIAKVHRGFSTKYTMKRIISKQRTSERQRNRFLRKISAQQ